MDGMELDHHLLFPRALCIRKLDLQDPGMKHNASAYGTLTSQALVHVPFHCLETVGMKLFSPRTCSSMLLDIRHRDTTSQSNFTKYLSS